MTIELSNNELKMINEALWSYMAENDSLNADLIIDILNKIEEII